MAINYTNNLKRERMLATRDYLAGGVLEIQASNDAVLASFDISATGGAIANDVWTLEVDDANVDFLANGQMAKARMKASSGVAHVTGLTVGTAGADIIVSSLTAAAGDPVSLVSAQIRHA